MGLSVPVQSGKFVDVEQRVSNDGFLATGGSFRNAVRLYSLNPRLEFRREWDAVDSFSVEYFSRLDNREINLIFLHIGGRTYTKKMLKSLPHGSIQGCSKLIKKLTEYEW